MLSGSADKIDMLTRQVLQMFSEKLDSIISLCESPIETQFLLNFIYYYENQDALHTYLNFLFDWPETSGQTVTIPKGVKVFKTKECPYNIPYGISIEGGFHEKILIIPQKIVSTELATYRLDFLVEYYRMDGEKVSICIECDGHDFHQKDKKTVARDYMRDRDLKSNNYTVFRFSGHEIYNQHNFEIFIKQIHKTVNIGIKDDI